LRKSSRIMFSTANGRIESRNVVPLYCSELDQEVYPYLLHESPPVLSIGKRCMEQGFTFHWDPGRNPIMTNPQGTVVELEVLKNIPYLRSGSEFSCPRQARETKTVAIAPTVEQEDDEDAPPATLCLAGEEEGLLDDAVNEEEYADSEELDAMMPQGDDTPVVSDEESENHHEEVHDEEPADPGGVSPRGDAEPIEPEGVIPYGDMGGEAQDVISGADPAQDAQQRARLSVNDKLRAEALSLDHKLSHLPKNPFCEACTMGKMKEKYSRRSAFKRELTEWGEIITCDHVYSGSSQSLGLDGETETFLIKDLFSGLMHSFPVPSKAASHVVQCIQQFVGSRKVQLLYSDNAK
jgi:hypothetical protein